MYYEEFEQSCLDRRNFMHDKLTIQERIRDLRQEKKLTLEQLSEQTGLSKSALGSYESNDTKDISHYAIIRLAKFYGVTTDYLLGISEQKTVGVHLCIPTLTLLQNRGYYPLKRSTEGYYRSLSRTKNSRVCSRILRFT